MVKGYCGHFGIKLAEAELEREALEWSTTRGSRSGALPGSSRRNWRAGWREDEHEVARFLSIESAARQPS